VIVAETPAGFRFVTQPAHARLAGRFAASWGAGGFDRPEPRSAVLTAADVHDDGWAPYDRRPHLGDDGAPVDFVELDAATWVPRYEAGIDAAVARDPYAGLLVSLHGAGLRRRRYGLSPSWPEPPSAFDAFVESEEARQRELLAAMRRDGDDRVTPADADLLERLHETGGPPPDATSRLWANYARLQAWDTLSLACCRTASPPAYDALDGVPRGPGRPDATLSLSALGGDAIGVEPYPFDADPLAVEVPARTVDRDACTSDDALAAAYAAAEPEPIRLTLRSV